MLHICTNLLISNLFGLSLYLYLGIDLSKPLFSFDSIDRLTSVVSVVSIPKHRYIESKYRCPRYIDASLPFLILLCSISVSRSEYRSRRNEFRRRSFWQNYVIKNSFERRERLVRCFCAFSIFFDFFFYRKASWEIYSYAVRVHRVGPIISVTLNISVIFRDMEKFYATRCYSLEVRIMCNLQFFFFVSRELLEAFKSSLLFQMIYCTFYYRWYCDLVENLLNNSNLFMTLN